jgi:hypothetical protein
MDRTEKKPCVCDTWKDNQVILIGYETVPDEFFLRFDILKERNPWLGLACCNVCAQCWYIGTDTVDDEYHLLRLTQEQVTDIVLHDKWPEIFEDFKNVWPDPNYQ